MNVNLLNIVNQIVAAKGENVLADPQQLKPLFTAYAKNEPKDERVAFGRCIEIGSYQELKSAPSVNERLRRKKNLADQLNVKYKIDKKNCVDALDLLEAAIFNKSTTPTQVHTPPPVPASAPPAPTPAPVPSITVNTIIQNPNAQNPNVQNTNVPNRRFRHGFASFWLWISFLSSIFGLLAILLVLFVYDEYIAGIIGYIYPSLSSDEWLYWLIGISAATVFGLGRIIFAWKRSGFYLLVLADIASIVLAFIYIPGEVVSTIISCSVFLLLTFLILKIHNSYNALSTWEQLD